MKYLPLILLSVSLLGCGNGRPQLVPVEGTITIDGEPLADAFVVFQVVEVEGDYKRPSKGVTDANGKFQVGTFDANDGLPIGTYRVGIQKRELIGELPEDYNAEAPQTKPIKYKLIVPKMYENPEESGLTAEVTSDGLKPANFEIQSGSPEIVTEGGFGGGA